MGFSEDGKLVLPGGQTPGELRDTFAATPEDTVSAGDTETASAEEIEVGEVSQSAGGRSFTPDDIRRAIDGATLLLEGDDGRRREATVRTDSNRDRTTEQTREFERLGERRTNV
jgi:hypothetical protein